MFAKAVRSQLSWVKLAPRPVFTPWKCWVLDRCQVMALARCISVPLVSFVDVVVRLIPQQGFSKSNVLAAEMFKGRKEVGFHGGFNKTRGGLHAETNPGAGLRTSLGDHVGIGRFKVVSRLEA